MKQMGTLLPKGTCCRGKLVGLDRKYQGKDQKISAQEAGALPGLSALILAHHLKAGKALVHPDHQFFFKKTKTRGGTENSVLLISLGHCEEICQLYRAMHKEGTNRWFLSAYCTQCTPMKHSPTLKNWQSIKERIKYIKIRNMR